jgi:DNA repair exonuclease SbcCD nuclease subunit
MASIQQPRPIAVALGDIHLDPLIWTRWSAVTGDSFLGYRSFLDVAARLQVPAIIVGDLFDVAKPTPDMVRFHRECMDLCQRQHVPVYALQGNHDKQPGRSWASATHDWPVYVGDGTPFRLSDDIQATALDYATLDEIEPLVRGVRTPVLFLHQAVKQALGFEHAWNCDLDWIPEEVRLTVLGDIHQPLDFVIGNGRRACYTGAGHARDITQVTDKSVVVIHDDLTYTRVPIPSRQIQRFEVRTQQDLDAAASWLSKAAVVGGLKPLAWLAASAEMAASCAELRSSEQTAGRALVVTERLSEDVVESETVAATIVDDDISPVAQLSKMVPQEKDPELFGLISELIDDRQNMMDIITRRKSSC